MKHTIWLIELKMLMSKKMWYKNGNFFYKHLCFWWKRNIKMLYKLTKVYKKRSYTNITLSILKHRVKSKDLNLLNLWYTYIKLLGIYLKVIHKKLYFNMNIIQQFVNQLVWVLKIYQNDIILLLFKRQKIFPITLHNI
jgi:hypothetical protein